MASLDLVSALLIKELGVGCQVRNIVGVIVETIAIVWTARNSAGGGRGGFQSFISPHPQHLIQHNHQHRITSDTALL